MIITLIQYENGGKIEVYQQVDRTTSDFRKIYACLYCAKHTCCEYFAKQGKKVLITPAFLVHTIGNPEYEAIYASLRGTQYWGKCPDFCVYSAEHKDGVWYEHEGYDIKKDFANPIKRADTFSKMMKRGLKQSNRLIVEDCGATIRFIRRNIFNRIHYEKQNIKEVYMRVEDGLKLLYHYNEQTRETYSI